MSHNQEVMIAVAPNGARKTQKDHPQLPISPKEIAHTAAACQEAGACMLHLHVRDKKLVHSLDVDRYRKTIQAIRQEVGGSSSSKLQRRRWGYIIESNKFIQSVRFGQKPYHLQFER